MRWLDRTLLASPLQWCLCINQKQFNKARKELKVPPDGYLLDNAGATVHFIISKDGYRAAVVSLGDTEGMNKAQIYALLVHEVMHIWQEVLELMGEESPGSEVEAYCVQAMTQNLLMEYERQVSQPARKGKHRRKQNGK